MRHVPEDVQRVDLERVAVARVVIRPNELDPSQQRVVSPGGIVDGGITYGEAGRLRAGAHQLGMIVPSVRDGDIPLDPSKREGDVHPRRLRSGWSATP